MSERTEVEISANPLVVLISDIDDDSFYLERREVGTWGVSNEVFKSAYGAVMAYKLGRITWDEE